MTDDGTVVHPMRELANSMKRRAKVGVQGHQFHRLYDNGMSHKPLGYDNYFDDDPRPVGILYTPADRDPAKEESRNKSPAEVANIFFPADYLPDTNKNTGLSPVPSQDESPNDVIFVVGPGSVKKRQDTLLHVSVDGGHSVWVGCGEGGGPPDLFCVCVCVQAGTSVRSLFGNARTDVFVCWN